MNGKALIKIIKIIRVTILNHFSPDNTLLFIKYKINKKRSGIFALYNQGRALCHNIYFNLYFAHSYIKSTCTRKRTEIITKLHLYL